MSMQPAARTIRLGLLGFGSVGQAFAQLVIEERDRLRRHGVDLVITSVCTRRFGARSEEAGLDVHQLVETAAAGGWHGPSVEAVAFVTGCPADVIVEMLPQEPFTGATATAATRAALTAGRSVVSANKGPVAHACRDLTELAQEHGVSYRYESAVADGLPVFNLIRHCLPGAEVTAFRGVLNSTSQLVLQGLADGGTVDAAVAAAQAAGIAEADPTYDLDGWDSALKLAALSAAVWGEPLDLERVVREPVGPADAGRAHQAAAAGRRLVSLGELERSSDGQVDASVRLVELGPTDPFFAFAERASG